MSDKITIDEMTDSLTGFEEIAIAKHFNAEWTDLAEHKPTMMLRAMVFTHLTRGDLSASDARAKAMGMPLREVNAYFDAEEEPVPDEPVTESGKDDSQPE